MIHDLSVQVSGREQGMEDEGMEVEGMKTKERRRRNGDEGMDAKSSGKTRFRIKTILMMWTLRILIATSPAAIFYLADISVK